MAVFKNCPYELIRKAFHNLYPDKEYLAYFQEGLRDPEKNKVHGVIVYPEDGTMPIIQIDSEETIQNSTEVFVHELAHLATGHTDDAHGELFMNHYNAIFDECERIDPKSVVSN